MKQKLLIVGLWLQATSTFLLISLLVLSGIVVPPMRTRISTMQKSTIAEGTSDSTGQILGVFIKASDARSLLLTEFISNHRPNSPLLPYATSFIQTADTYGIDYRLIPAIAMCESNLGARIPSKDSFNAWGIAVYTGQQHGRKFSDWPEAIDWVGKFIKEKFYNKNITDLREIGAIWAPPSVAKDYSWTRCVTSFMDDIQ